MSGRLQNVISEIQSAFAAAAMQLRAERYQPGEYAWKVHHDTPDGKKLTLTLRVDIKERTEQDEIVRRAELKASRESIGDFGDDKEDAL